MLKIEDIISGDFSAYPKETQELMTKYTEILRENIKAELINDRAVRMLKDIDKGNEIFINLLTELLENGSKGFNKMSTQALLNIYLESKGHEDFIKLLEKVNEEV
ncbi:MAG: hypothetical protein H7Y18_03195 [Clostridiaceae bacterium]|nr:hypothetical protein [Clostridiaceae bacterium]